MHIFNRCLIGSESSVVELTDECFCKYDVPQISLSDNRQPELEHKKYLIIV